MKLPRHFASEVSTTLDKLHRETPIKSLIVIAPPRILAALRRAFSNELKRSVIMESGKDLSKHPVHEIQRHLTGK